MKKYILAAIAAALMMSISPAAVGAYEADKDWFKRYSSLSEEDQLSISSAPQYRLPDGSLAKGLVSIGGIKYRFNEKGMFIGEYTGWTKNINTGVRHYYIDGKRQAGWRTINGKTYYFYYEGGIASYWTQIEDKWYSFDENGVFQGGVDEAEVYLKNLTDDLYADDLPESISISLRYYTDTDYFKFHLSDRGPDIQRYENGKWTDVEMDKDYLKANGITLYSEWYEKKYDESDEYGFVTDEVTIPVNYYNGRLTPGKYRAAVRLDVWDGGCEGYTDYIYSYFTIK